MTLPIALDAMGGDFAPGEIVAGARRAVDELGLNVILVGVPELLGDPRGLEVVACSEVIAMDDDPGVSVRKKKDSSLVRAAELVRDNKASAMVSAGNTGATMASALLRMGRLPGVIRPCIATPIPRPNATPMLLVDAGANAECKPEMLVQFAQMASTYVRAHYGVDSPKVGLLSIGEESSKGTPLVKETNQLLAAMSSLNFVGNVEGRDLPAGGTDQGALDVVVCDGFVGNVVLKFYEAVTPMIVGLIQKSCGIEPATLARSLGQLDYSEHGGAPLLGVRGVSIISHGKSSPRAIMNAIKVGVRAVDSGMNNLMTERLAASEQKHQTAEAS